MPRSNNSLGLTQSQQRALGSLVVLVLLVVAGFILPRLDSGTPAPVAVLPATATTTPATAVPVSQSGIPSWLNVHFTDPNPPDDLQNGVDRFIVPLIDGAQKTIDATTFDLNLPDAVNALVKAKQRGVQVRVVYDGKNGDPEVDNDAVGKFNGPDTLTRAKVPLVDGGRSNGLMHDKILIVDGKTLVMGSWNLSYNDTFRNNNNLLIITDPQLIANYQAKFNELFVQKHFGTKARVGAQTPSLAVQGVPVENYFSPVDKVMAKLVGYVQGAKKSVHFMIFTYTDDDLANAMIARAKAGVDVQGVIENRGASQGALVPLGCAKLPVKTDGNKYTMHHKVIIVDGQYVITGSFNFTVSADQANDDNVLVIHSPAVAALYEQEYQRVLAIAQAPSAADIQCK